MPRHFVADSDDDDDVSEGSPAPDFVINSERGNRADNDDSLENGPNMTTSAIPFGQESWRESTGVKLNMKGDSYSSEITAPGSFQRVVTGFEPSSGVPSQTIVPPACTGDTNPFTQVETSDESLGGTKNDPWEVPSSPETQPSRKPTSSKPSISRKDQAETGANDSNGSKSCSPHSARVSFGPDNSHANDDLISTAPFSEDTSIRIMQPGMTSSQQRQYEEVESENARVRIQGHCNDNTTHDNDNDGLNPTLGVSREAAASSSQLTSRTPKTTKKKAHRTEVASPGSSSDVTAGVSPLQNQNDTDAPRRSSVDLPLQPDTTSLSAEPKNAEVSGTKRKRGRPKKTEAAKKAEGGQKESLSAVRPEDSPQPSKKRGRPKKSTLKTTTTTKGTEDVKSSVSKVCSNEEQSVEIPTKDENPSEEESKPTSNTTVSDERTDISHIKADQKTLEIDGQKPQKMGDTRKPAALKNSFLQKPIYRVGLSKRSRIAPLLKSLQK